MYLIVLKYLTLDASVGAICCQKFAYRYRHHHITASNCFLQFGYFSHQHYYQ